MLKQEDIRLLSKKNLTSKILEETHRMNGKNGYIHTTLI